MWIIMVKSIIKLDLVNKRRQISSLRKPEDKVAINILRDWILDLSQLILIIYLKLMEEWKDIIFF